VSGRRATASQWCRRAEPRARLPVSILGVAGLPITATSSMADPDPGDRLPSHRRSRRVNRRRELYSRVGIAAAVVALVAGLALIVTETVHLGGDRPSLARAVVTPDARGSASGATTLPTRPCRAPLTADDPLRLWIGGDSLAGSLGPSLGDIAGATGVIQPYFDSRVSSGLTSPNFFDWPTHAEAEMERLDPEIAVFIIGANDYPATMQGVAPTTSTASGSSGSSGSSASDASGTVADDAEPWNIDYAERVEAMYTTLSKPGRTVIWVGPPSFKNERENAAIQLISSVSKGVIDRHPDGVFVDDYTLFLDSNGKYADRLPDQRGNLVTVRTGDGVHFTPDGAERLAELEKETGRSLAVKGRQRAPHDHFVVLEEGSPDTVDDKALPVERGQQLQVELEEDAGIEVPDLRPGDEERLAGRRAPGADEQRVRHLEPRRLRHRRRRRRLGVDHDVADLARPGTAEREPARECDARLRVVALAQVLEHLATVLGAELLLEQREELRAAHLLPAAGAEDGAHQPADRDDVVPRPARDRQVRPPVLRVDPGHIGVDQADRGQTLRALGPEQVELLREPRLDGLARAERPAGQRERERVHAGRVERGQPARAAQELHDQLAIGRGRPASAESDVRRGPSLDVRDAPAVARDRHARARPLGANGALRPQAERLALEVAPQVGVRDPVATCREALVERDLVGRALRQRNASRLPGRKDVPGLRGVVLRSRAGCGCGRDPDGGCEPGSGEDASQR